jgi:hypothetical protein
VSTAPLRGPPIPIGDTRDGVGRPEWPALPIAWRCSLLRLHRWKPLVSWPGTRMQGAECAACAHRRLVVLWRGKGTIMDIPYPRTPAFTCHRLAQEAAQDAARDWVLASPTGKNRVRVIRTG